MRKPKTGYCLYCGGPCGPSDHYTKTRRGTYVFFHLTVGPRQNDSIQRGGKLMRVKTTVRGITFAPGANKYNSLLEIRIISDDISKTLHVSDPAANVMFVIPLEPLARYLRVKEVKE